MENEIRQVNSHNPIKNWAIEERPRERLVQHGAQSLTAVELLAILFRTGTLRKSAVELSREVMKIISDNLADLSKLNVQQLTRINGIGTAKATQVIAALELARREQMAARDKITYIKSSAQAAQYMKPRIAHRQEEEFHVMFLSNGNRLIRHQHISSGGMSATIVDPRIIYADALSCRAARVLFCHNHPSGNLSASHADIQLTRRLRDAGKLLNIEVLDHIIIADTGYCSMVEEGLM
ncbi:DNA replication and repair protein RadC [Chitinophaga costaii]|uniref:DNA replication and repair protein RadC n=1 Tax=Chitinophaga costaii TaxID=1335309 RepID=A0A1C3ZYR4_9BACT|nr:DNA repair protein RadC [Chitinophaga costaii]PUZ30559.1 JAB domain-containing protein [Chitinophaga costaii]SCB87436.1 DNA replication and repair protein RadC [Chitinophaga costaii]